jgi:DNA-binding transcriptional LysR family regulator
MELYQLRTFVAVAQQGHLTRAAEQLHLSQPAVTAQIKALEEEVGMPLFERSAGGISLSLAGQELLPRAQSILAAARQMLVHAGELKAQPAGQLRVGISLSPDLLRLGTWASVLCARFPLLNLRLHHGVTVDVLNQVRKKELDGGFFLGKNPYGNVNSLVLTRLSFVLAMPPGDGAMPHGKELGKLPWIGISQFSSLNRLTSELWRELNIAPRKMAECDHLDAMVELVMAGVGLSLVREDLARRLEGEGRLRIVPGVVRQAELLFVYAADREEDPMLERLLEALAVAWPESPPTGTV